MFDIQKFRALCEKVAQERDPFKLEKLNDEMRDMLTEWKVEPTRDVRLN